MSPHNWPHNWNHNWNSDIHNIQHTDYSVYSQTAMYSVLIPALVTFAATFVQNNDVMHPLNMLYKMTESRPMVQAYDFFADTGYVYYTIAFFGGVPLALGALMIYNLILMFGLDIPIREAQKNFLDWFGTPPITDDEEAEETEAD